MISPFLIGVKKASFPNAGIPHKNKFQWRLGQDGSWRCWDVFHGVRTGSSNGSMVCSSGVSRTVETVSGHAIHCKYYLLVLQGGSQSQLDRKVSKTDKFYYSFDEIRWDVFLYRLIRLLPWQWQWHTTTAQLKTRGTGQLQCQSS